MSCWTGPKTLWVCLAIEPKKGSPVSGFLYVFNLVITTRLAFGWISYLLFIFTFSRSKKTISVMLCKRINLF